MHIKSFKGKGSIFEVAWNIEESRVAVCFSSNVVSIIDCKRPYSKWCIEIKMSSNLENLDNIIIVDNAGDGDT